MWWRRSAGAALSARLYVKPDCGLCEQAAAVLRSFDGRQLSVDQVNIENDPEIFRQFFLSIPVLELEGGARLAWPFTQADVKRLLRTSS
jgi:hypothetical protein